MKHILFAFLTATFLLSGCGWHYQVKKDLNAKSEALGGSVDFKALLKDYPKQQREALEFLYAYMPLGDISDYPVTLYAGGVSIAMAARETMPWGASVPEDLFRHFVLPLRVNNENLDNAREVFYMELKERVKSLSMYDAALEVNHWCHEKVIYTPSDGRTSSPLASVRTAYGRCGEESVLTVAALRSVGIPARQVYTPRWAHTDDNHAWVEVWVDGKWYYMGACEPEAKLNVAWFSATAQRSLLMHSKVFGRYRGSEDIISETPCYTEINVTANYAPVRKVEVLVTDPSGAPVSGAKVEFKIYNYAELYSAITKNTDKKGLASATFGLGDIIVWASCGDALGFSKVSVGTLTAPVTIVLDKKAGDAFYQELDIVPPAETRVQTTLTPEEVAANALRLAAEDSIRGLYTSTFVNADKYLLAARGNWKEISRYESLIPQNSRNVGYALLDGISSKDLRDTPSDVLLNHLEFYSGSEDPLQIKYVLNPRIALELLTPWRGKLGKEGLTPQEAVKAASQIKILDQYNPQHIPMSPCGVMALGAADSPSRDIYFVALCRNSGIPARLEEVSGKVQYWEEGIWHDVSFSEGEGASIAPKGELELSYQGQKYIDDPKFDTHFTVAKIEDGSILTLNFRDKEGLEGTSSWKGLSEKPIELDCGWYMLTTGTRMASGKVLGTLTFFNISEGEATPVELIMREDRNDLQVIGSMNPEDRFDVPLSDGSLVNKSILETTGRGFFFLAFVRSNHEPSNHAIRSLLEKEPNRPAIIFYKDMTQFKTFAASGFPAVPSNVTIGIDAQSKIYKSIFREMKLKNPEYPLIVVADTFGRIVYLSEGYNIGTAELLGRIAK